MGGRVSFVYLWGADWVVSAFGDGSEVVFEGGVEGGMWAAVGAGSTEWSVHILPFIIEILVASIYHNITILEQLKTWRKSYKYIVKNQFYSLFVSHIDLLDWF